MQTEGIRVEVVSERKPFRDLHVSPLQALQVFRYRADFPQGNRQYMATAALHKEMVNRNPRGKATPDAHLML